jgi:hypothetical protein
LRTVQVGARRSLGSYRDGLRAFGKSFRAAGAGKVGCKPDFDALGRLTVKLSRTARQLLGYRLYCLNEKGGIVGVEEALCPSDEHAIAEAERMLGRRPRCQGVEVWDRARLVGRVPRGEAVA